MAERAREDLGRKAKTLLATGIAGDPLVTASGKVREPIPIRSSGKEIAGWFVAVDVDGMLAGFLQFDERGTLRRYSSFQRRAGTVEGCPPTQQWTDRKTIATTAAKRLGKGFRLKAPYLTYDGNLDRIVWAVPALHERGGARTVYVAGEYSYLAER
jgi:hypothetical protein